MTNDPRDDWLRADHRFLLMWIGNLGDGMATVLGPSREFRAVGGEFRKLAHRHPLATFHDGQWRRTESSLPCIAIWSETPTHVTFENPATGEQLPLGCFEMLGIVGNKLYVEREHSRPVACLDRQSILWRSYTDPRDWTDLVLRPGT